jgi:hypothetical protein
MAASGSILIEYIYTIRITVSSINLDANYIIAQFAALNRIEAGDLYRIFIEQCGNFNSNTRNSWRLTNYMIRDV